MTKQEIIDSILFWSGSEWSYYSGDTAWIPLPVSTGDWVIITDAIGRLYDSSASARAWLETIASQGPIRIGAESNNSSYVPPYPIVNDGTTTYTDPFIKIDAHLDLKAFTGFGTLFQMPLDVIIAHELAHWSLGTADVVTPTNAAMNQADYDYVGDTVRAEWTASLELGVTDLRASYAAGFTAIDPRLAYVDLNADYCDGYAEIVRLGDFEETASHTLIAVDAIDFSARTDGRTALAFGFTGDDVMTGSSAAEWLYGGTDRDTIRGGDDRDWLDGGDGNDFIEDMSVQIGIVDPTTQNIINGGDGNDVVICADAVVTTGAGSDQIWLGDLSFVTITDPSATDTLFWNGYQITGGTSRMLDVEIDTNSGDVIWADWYTADDNGIVYDQSRAGELDLLLPYGGGSIIIQGWSNGDMGIDLSGAAHEATIAVFLDDDGHYAGYTTSLPHSPYEMNGTSETLFDVIAMSSIGPAGSLSAPTTFLV